MNQKFRSAQVDLEVRREPDRITTGISWMDDELDGGLARGTLCEVCSAGGEYSTGGAVVLLKLLRQSVMTRRYLMLIDAADSFDPCSFGEQLCNVMLWARCRSVEESLQVADLVLRDANLPLVVYDLQLCPRDELRRVPSSSWYRLRGVIKDSGVVCVVLTPFAMIRCAGERFELTSKFRLPDCESPETEWESRLQGRRRNVGMTELANEEGDEAEEMADDKGNTATLSSS